MMTKSPNHRSRSISWRTAGLLAVVLLVALAARLIFWRSQSIVSVDGTNYIRLARAMFGGAHHDSQQPPGYPLLIGLMTPLAGGDDVLAARLIDLICGLALLVPFFFLARRFFGTRLAFILGLILGLTPIMIRYSITTMSESPYLLFVLLAVLAFECGTCWAAGALAGVAFLIRPEAIVLAGALALSRIRKPREWGVMAAAFLLAGMIPALLFNHHATGSWTLTQKGVNMASEELWRNEPTVEGMTDHHAQPSMIQRIRTNAGSVRTAFPKRLGAEVKNLAGAIGWPLTVAVIPGLMTSPVIVTAGLAQALFVPLIPGVPPVPRLVVALIPFVLLLGAGIVYRLATGRRSRVSAGGATELVHDRAPPGPIAETNHTKMPAARARPVMSLRSLRTALIVAFILAAGWATTTLNTFDTLMLQEDGYFPEMVDAGRSLAGHLRPGDLIFDRKPYVAFYAGARYQAIPVGGYIETIDAVVTACGDYLVVDESVCIDFRPALFPLIRDSFTMLNDPRLDLIYFDGRYKDRHLAIYRIIRPGGPPPPPGSTDGVRKMVMRIPHDPAQHVLHAQLLVLARREQEARAEDALARRPRPFTR